MSVYLMCIFQIYDLTGYTDFKGIACDADKLEEFLVLPSDIEAVKVSQHLCNINDSLVPDLVQEIQTELSLANIIKMVSVTP